VPSLARRLFAALELARLPVAFGAVAGVWTMILLVEAGAGAAGSAPGSPEAIGGQAVASAASEAGSIPGGAFALPLRLAAGALVAIGFLAFGAILNDFLDAKHDRAFAPDRPIPSGAVQPRRAIQLALAALVAGFGGAAAFGTTALVLAMAMAALILVYDAFAKHVPALGIVLTGLLTALAMLVPSFSLSFGAAMTAPVWLAMSQTMGLGLAAYILAEKRPKLSPRAIAAGFAGWSFWSAAILGLGAWRAGEAGGAGWDGIAGGISAGELAIPALATVVGGALAAWKLRAARGATAGSRVLRYGSLWKALVAASWLLAAGLATEAAWIGGLAVAIFAATALAREAGPQLLAPVSWRS
jgi:4-hydroxybenzoate polyprenyltransferase